MERCVDDDVVVSTNDEKVQSHIPNDLSFSILSKLAVKSLKRFECVCKSWSLLFDNPNFTKAYRKSFLTKIRAYYDEQDTSVLIHKTNDFPFEGFYNERTFELYSVSSNENNNLVKLDWPNVILDRLPGYDSGFDILRTGSSIQGTLCDYKLMRHIQLPQNCDYAKEYFMSPDFDIKYFLKNQEIQQDFGDEEDFMWEIYSLRTNSWRKLDVDNDIAYA
ncbi:unnamed protein product [Trifolium pratense]|uniref:Uncharacterized protein n=1 Tax=Trifolium pratense TaxID=57577 RepID=A0ACB0K4L2_TRIPR|nr:unnamed protein product [Trifolium pratense]